MVSNLMVVLTADRSVQPVVHAGTLIRDDRAQEFLLRLNPKLHRVLERWATDDMRSVNSQIEFLLIEAGRHAGRWNADASKEREGAARPAYLEPERGVEPLTLRLRIACSAN